MRFAGKLFVTAYSLALAFAAPLAVGAEPAAPRGVEDRDIGVPLRERAQSPEPASVAKERIREAEDGEWISLSGKVQSVGERFFTLALGENEILVEMDDYGSNSADLLRQGDKVTVTGRMDTGFYEKRKIEASSVFVQKLLQYFYANPKDEEEGYYSYPVSSYNWSGLAGASDDDWVVFVGTVLMVDGDEIVVDTGPRNVSVDTSSLLNKPFGSVDVGDRVSVSGELDEGGLFDNREVEATSVVILTEDRRR